jgi:hypothetical protein
MLAEIIRKVLTAGQTRCEACGEEFACGATLKGCWCSEVTLSEATRAELRSQFSGCLCEKCLKERQSRAAAQESAPDYPATAAN